MEDDFFGSELDKSISEMEASETITKSNLDDDYIKKLYEETDEQRKINEATVYVDSDQQAIEADPNASFENLQSKVRDSFVEQSEFDDLEYDMEIQENIKTKNENMARYGTNDPNEIAEIIKEQVISEGWVLDDDPRLEGDDAAFLKLSIDIKEENLFTILNIENYLILEIRWKENGKLLEDLMNIKHSKLRLNQ